jgi:ribulose-phosphate 3-epimerase
MSRPALLEQLGHAAPLIAPSMLKCDFGNLHREVELLEAAGAPLLHFDVMDGHFVPNLSYGAMVIAGARPLTSLPFEAHLMISDPQKYVDEYVAAGCQMITFHIEAVPQPVPLLRRIRQAGCLAGLSLNPGTPVSAIAGAIGECDNILVMSVEPGFGGQSFKPDVLEKVTQVRRLAADATIISIDGGIGPRTIGASAAAGANLFVVGSAIFDEPDYRAAIEELERQSSAAL